MASGPASASGQIDVKNYNEQIDALLEQYLILLDEYSTLRAQLAKLQAGVYQNIARANFGADRGVRYGQDCYQAREGMKASRRVVISLGERDVPDFKVLNVAERKPDDDESAMASRDASREKEDGTEKKEEEEADDGKEKTKPSKKKNQNPLQWFGLMAPQALRSAQGQAVEVVEKVIPRLAAVNAEMLDIEIEIGRARKKRARADAAARKGSSKTAVEASCPPAVVEAS